mmetsp:Transcript_38625/g.123938  ORF Transcript_38625/g.123938 Transcript_38625/m.123938 type:complete len:211 (+) Transcript_38625:167-799(+)
MRRTAPTYSMCAVRSTADPAPHACASSMKRGIAWAMAERYATARSSASGPSLGRQSSDAASGGGGGGGGEPSAARAAATVANAADTVSSCSVARKSASSCVAAGAASAPPHQLVSPLSATAAAAGERGEASESMSYMSAVASSVQRSSGSAAPSGGSLTQKASRGASSPAASSPSCTALCCVALCCNAFGIDHLRQGAADAHLSERLGRH